MTDLAKYANMKICAAVSGGKDSMALLHYLYVNAKDYGIKLSALNCDHKMRGVASARDSAFVKEWCRTHAVPLISFEWDFESGKTESSARLWRLSCYTKASKAQTLSNGKKWEGADAIATAHHLNDNAETVLFNLARGSALSGLDGITDVTLQDVKLIRPFISCSRKAIDEYVTKNEIAYVEDESNFTDDYTRNKIRHNVLPELEKAVPNAAGAIYRFSRLAAEDEEYFNEVIKSRGMIKSALFGKQIGFCEEKVIFRRAAVKVIKECFGKKDYTSEHVETLYNLQFAENGKKFEFLGLTALKEEGKITIFDSSGLNIFEEPIKFNEFCGSLYCGQLIKITAEIKEELSEKVKKLKFDLDKIPNTAVIRFMKEGDKFTKFGGGTKSLGDYFTDKKIPVRIRTKIPLIADGSEILAVGGVEISDKIKITDKTKNIFYLICADYQALK